MIALLPALTLGLLALLIFRHAYGLSQRWYHYRHGPSHIDDRRPLAVSWAFGGLAAVLLAIWAATLAAAP